MHFTTSIVYAACTAASLFSGALAVPVQSATKLVSRTVFDPLITFPAGNETFYAGQTITTTWDTSELPQNLPNQGFIVLAMPVGDSEGIILNSTLASGFLLTQGEANITFPSDLATADNYAIVLFGDSGNISNTFTILGSNSTTASN